MRIANVLHASDARLSHSRRARGALRRSPGWVTPGAPPETFPRAARLTRRPDFLTVQERGRRVSGSSYLLLALARPGAPEGARARLGITVSKKVGKAAVRNQVKRWVRESYRRMSDLAP